VPTRPPPRAGRSSAFMGFCACRRGDLLHEHNRSFDRSCPCAAFAETRDRPTSLLSDRVRRITPASRRPSTPGRCRRNNSVQAGALVGRLGAVHPADQVRHLPSDPGAAGDASHSAGRPPVNRVKASSQVALGEVKENKRKGSNLATDEEGWGHEVSAGGRIPKRTCRGWRSQGPALHRTPEEMPPG
jgi:hypothetical protein